MPRRTTDQGRSRLPSCLVLVLSALGWSVSALGAQELPLKREVPASGPYECPSVATADMPGAPEQAQARQLASTAAQAVILGDLDRARALLDRATELDPASADLAYRHARVLEDLGERSAAVSEFCRVLALNPRAEGVDDARDRIESLESSDRVTIPASAIEAFQDGLAGADAGLLERALTSFDSAAARAPDWPDAIYDRGVIFARLGRTAEASRDLRRYLELVPGAPDGIAVSERIGELQGVALAPTPSPGTALALGILVPGMGQFYSGRAVGGLTVLALAGGAVATGLFVKKVEVQCLSAIEPGQDCPAGQVVGEDVTYPYRIPAIGAAAAVGLVGAIEAFIHLRGQRSTPAFEEASEAARDAGPRLEMPTVAAHGRHVDVGLLRVTFR